MERSKRPTYANGKICYIEIPAADVMLSASFYKEIFGWKIHQRSDGQFAFDDPVGEVSGTWVMGRNTSQDTGILIYIMVESVTSTIKRISAKGGKIIELPDKDSKEITARFSDPAENVFGLYQEPVIEMLS
jgi:predicted enzyme related to lactoylglutathione lyase